MLAYTYIITQIVMYTTVSVMAIVATYLMLKPDKKEDNSNYGI